MGETAFSTGATGTRFTSEDKVGLGAAIVMHLLLVAVLALQFAFTPPRSLTPERMTVSLATEVSLESTAPDPVAESRAAIAPTLAEVPAPEVRQEIAELRPAAPVPPPPTPQTQTRPSPRAPARTAPPRPTPTRSAPQPPAPSRDRSRPDRQPDAPARAASNAGGSRIGDSFLEGQGSSAQTDETRVPASQIGRSARASLQQAINRQLKPHWNAPEGVDAERLISVVSWQLNPDGSLKGRPQCNSDPSGVTDSNRPQVGLHCERAIRAVQLAAPFDLPDEYYEAWKNITSWRFDRRL